MNVNRAFGKKIIKSDAKKPRGRKRRGARGFGAQAPRGPKRISYAAVGNQVWNDISWLRRFVNTEMHYSDTTNSTNISSTSTLVLLNGLSQGDSATTRTGQSIKMDALDMNCYILGNATAVQLTFRVLVVYDKQPNGAAYSATSLLNVDNTISMYAVGGQNRFVVYFDQSYAVSNGGPSNICFSKRIQLGQHTEFNTGNAGTVADINTGSLYLQFVSDQATNVPIIAYYARLWFVDN